MIGFLIGILTVLLVFVCLIMILLVLVQLPKKEAGAGMAFGAGAADTLLGAGSGTALTKLTKYAAGAFFVLAFTLTVIQSNRQKSAASGVSKALSQSGGSGAPTMSAPAGVSNAPAAVNGIRPLANTATNNFALEKPVTVPAVSTNR